MLHEMFTRAYRQRILSHETRSKIITRSSPITPSTYIWTYLSTKPCIILQYRSRQIPFTWCKAWRHEDRSLDMCSISHIFAQLMHDITALIRRTLNLCTEVWGQTTRLVILTLFFTTVFDRITCLVFWHPPASTGCNQDTKIDPLICVPYLTSSHS